VEERRPRGERADILYLEDTDGDGRADASKVVLTGFAEVNPQLRINTPLYGLDNWIYAAYPRFGTGVRFKQFSNMGQSVRFPDHPEIAPVDIFSKGIDLRFKPDPLKLEAVSGTRNMPWHSTPGDIDSRPGTTSMCSTWSSRTHISLTTRSLC